MTPAAYVEARARRARPPRLERGAGLARRRRRASAASARRRDDAPRLPPPPRRRARPTTAERFDRAGGPCRSPSPCSTGFTALDAIGPYEVLSRLPGARVDVRRRTSPGVVRTDNGMLGADRRRARSTTLPEPDVARRARRHRHARADAATSASSTGCATRTSTSRWTTSVCTGSLLLAAAGMLDGLEATTHWLVARPARASSARARRPSAWSSRARSITAAGVSAGIDMALTLAARIAGDDDRAGDPARDRVRPAAAVRRGLAGQGAARGGRADPRDGRGRPRSSAPRPRFVTTGGATRRRRPPAAGPAARARPARRTRGWWGGGGW